MDGPDVDGEPRPEDMPRWVLEKEVRRSRETIRALKKLTVACAARILEQSNLLSKKAEKGTNEG